MQYFGSVTFASNDTLWSILVSTNWLHVLWILTAVLANLIIAIILIKTFTDKPIEKKLDSPASFYALRQVTSKANARLLGLLCVVPVTLLFLVLMLNSQMFINTTRDGLVGYITSSIDIKWRSDARTVLDAIPVWLNPIFVSIAIAILFGSTIMVPVLWFRNTLFEVIGIEDRANLLARQAAGRVTEEIGIKEARKRLRAIYEAELPLPEQMVQAPETDQLAYQLIFFSRDHTPIEGLRVSLANTLVKLRVTPDERSPINPIAYKPIFAALTFYLVLCCVYLVSAPWIGFWLQSNDTLKALLQPLEWPKIDEDGIKTIILGLSQATLSFVIPLGVGMYLYNNKSRNVRKLKNINQTNVRPTIILRIIAAYQAPFYISLFFNAAFVVLDITRRWAGDNTGSHISLFNLKILTEILTLSLVPCAALFAWATCRQSNMAIWFTAFIVCIVAAASFFGSQYTYEAVSHYECVALGQDCTGKWRGYYWHQMLLGGFITATYYLAASIARMILPPVETQELRGS